MRSGEIARPACPGCLYLDPDERSFDPVDSAIDALLAHGEPELTILTRLGKGLAAPVDKLRQPPQATFAKGLRVDLQHPFRDGCARVESPRYFAGETTS